MPRQPFGSEVRRAVMLIETDEQVVAVEVDGVDAEIDATVQYERPDPWREIYHSSWTRLVPEAAELTLTVHAHCYASAEKHYVWRFLPRWPELSADDPRCAARLAPVLGLHLRCERWRGHDPLAHASGATTWLDGDARSLAPHPIAA